MLKILEMRWLKLSYFWCCFVILVVFVSSRADYDFGYVDEDEREVDEYDFFKNSDEQIDDDFVNEYQSSEEEVSNSGTKKHVSNLPEFSNYGQYCVEMFTPC